MKHTPRPWRTDIYTSITAQHPIVLAKGEKIADVYGNGGMEESEANARLIAAAPELLEVCKTICDTLDAQDDFAPAWMSKLRKAIAKAEGK